MILRSELSDTYRSTEEHKSAFEVDCHEWLSEAYTSHNDCIPRPLAIYEAAQTRAVTDAQQGPGNIDGDRVPCGKADLRAGWHSLPQEHRLTADWKVRPRYYLLGVQWGDRPALCV